MARGMGVGPFIKQNSCLTSEELDVGSSETREDILAVRIGKEGYSEAP